MSEWTSRLRQASFRGVPFAVRAGQRTGGRRVAVHEFPDRDDPVVEDLGGSAQRISLRGFIVEDSAVYGGGDVLDQRTRLEAAGRAAGPGVLVHPTRGPLVVNCLSWSIDDQEEGRFFEVGFEFVEAGASGLVVSVLSTATGVLDAAESALSLFSGLFGSGADGYAGSSGAAGDVSAVASLFGSSASALGGGVAGVFSLGSGVSANAAAALAGASSGFLTASRGLGSLLGSGASTAAAAVRVTRSISSLSGAGSAIDSMGSLADLFG